MQDAFAHCEAAGARGRQGPVSRPPCSRRPSIAARCLRSMPSTSRSSRVREAVREPLAGEIRLQWWSDVLAGEGRGEVAANPVAAALLAIAGALSAAGGAARGADRGASVRSLRRADGDASQRLKPTRDERLVRSHRARRANSRCRQAGRRSTRSPTMPVSPMRLTGLLKAFPIHAARGQLYVPLDVLERHGAGRPEVLQRAGDAGIARGARRIAPRRPPPSRPGARAPADCAARDHCPRCCRSRWCVRRSRAWSGATTIRSCRSRSRHGGGNG